uniref:Uncharacterized protein n=1 Tax=Aegilops tauschii TaxID=37682 RepID=M8CPK9_AEGTA
MGSYCSSCCSTAATICMEPVTQMRPPRAAPPPSARRSSREAAFIRSQENGAAPHPINIGAGLSVPAVGVS